MYEKLVEEGLSKIKRSDVVVQGQNPKITAFYNIWKGVPSWLNYKYHLPNGEYKDAKMLTLNLPKYISRAWANSYANENTTITIPNKDSNERLQEILFNNNFFGKFNSFVEGFMALGIGATLVNLDKFSVDKNGNVLKNDSKVKINYIGGRRVIPISVNNGDVVECAFINFRTNGITLIIHYLNDKNEYEIAEINGIGKSGKYELDFNNINVLITDSKMPLYQIWRPNIAEDDEVENVVGTSIFSEALDAFKSADLNYTAFFKEVKLGQKVKFITADVLKYDANGNAQHPFDENDESVIAVEPGTDGKSLITEVNGELRIQSIISSINFHMNAAAMLCGLGTSTFEFDSSGGRPLQTATAVIAKQTELYRNVVKQENFATDNFRKLVYAIAYVNNNFTNNPVINVDKLIDIQITYDDNIVEDTSSKKTQDLQEVQAGVMSIAEYRAAWYDEDLETATKQLQENGMLVNVYLTALQAGAMTPEKYCELVYGTQDAATIEYIKMNLVSGATAPVDDLGYDDEA